jgi:outer membrane protein OmpA-like peptidoglycan-associated protein
MTVLLWLVGCVVPMDVKHQLDLTQQTLVSAHKVYAPLCAPQELANAQANLDFTRIELSQGNLRRAAEHLAVAQQNADAALRIATPCGGVDTDHDTIPDIVDECPKEPEDLDGDRDDDGCRDVDPYGDEDGDGIINLEDACADQAEDFDGDNDADGCPESSEDSDGDGIVNAADKCVDDPEDLDGFKDTDGCPDLDNDDDGISDLTDGCPLIAEDKDDWDDEDGCPDPDNDGDGVPDLNDNCRNTAGVRERQGCPLEDVDKDGVADDVDRCPTNPETANGYLDEDGCPDTPPGGVKVTRTRVEISDTIQFESGSARLLAESDPVLDRVVQVLKDAPYISLSIEGHTDGEASDEFNLELSRERALAVKTYLIKHGIDASRLTSVGYGETRPIDTNRTPAGRARNRRVEFHITSNDAGSAAP